MKKVQRREQVGGTKKRIRRVKAMIDGKVMLNDREGGREKVALAINLICAAALLLCAHSLRNTHVLWSPLTSTRCVCGFVCFLSYLANGHCGRFWWYTEKACFLILIKLNASSSVFQGR